MSHLISADQFTRHSLEAFFDTCDSIWKLSGPQGRPIQSEKIITTVFLEPSTRTRLSFESAMYKLGGKVMTVSDANTSSIVKGESIEDMVSTISSYSDIIALRTPHVGWADRAAKASSVPIINAGDGAGEHPTQALLDLYTIRSKRTLDDLTMLVCGDLLNGRTVHSLVKLLSLFRNLHLVLCAPEGFELASVPDGVKVSVVESVEEGKLFNPDVVYMTRLQKERMLYKDGVDYSKQTLNDLDGLKENCLVMHPMPRNDEIPTTLDTDKRCVYLREQPKNGVRVRMALIYSILSDRVHYGKRE